MAGRRWWWGLLRLVVASGLMLIGTASLAGENYWSVVENAPPDTQGYGHLHLRQVRYANGSLYAGGYGGLFRSDNNGTTWTVIDPGVVWDFAVDGDTVLWEQMPPMQENVLYRSTAKGANPQLAPDFFNWADSKSNMIEIEGDVALFGTDHGVYASNDGGATFHTTGLWDSMGYMEVLAGGIEGSTALVGLKRSYFNDGSTMREGGMWRSTQNGDYDSWDVVTTPGFAHAILLEDGIGLAQDNYGLLRTWDDGATWERLIYQGGPYLNTIVGEVKDFVIEQNAVFAATNTVWANPSQADMGKWQEINSNFPTDAEILSLTLSDLNGYTLFAAFDNGQLYELHFTQGLPEDGWDLTPPGGSMSVTPAASTNRTVAVNFSAYDGPTGGASGIQSAFIREYEWKPGSGWADALTTPTWRNYSSSFSYTLSDAENVHALVAYLCDNVGNVSQAMVDFVTLLPASDRVFEGQMEWYDIYAKSGANFTITVTPSSGDPDLYYWRPGNYGWSDGASYQDGSVPESISVSNATEGFYTFGVLGWTETTYQIRYQAGAVASLSGPAEPRKSAHQAEVSYSGPDAPDAEVVPTDFPEPETTPTPTPTVGPTATETPEPTATPTQTASPTVTPTPEPGATATPTPTASPTSAPTNTPTPTPTQGAGATPSPTASPTATSGEPQIRQMVRSFYLIILGREPEAGAVDSWHYGYFDYAVDFNIDVRFIPREMARIFFLSEEYAARGRSDAEFITDCYRVFLNREPGQSELDAWLGGEWERARVMTLFSESEEFAERIRAMYPGLEGDRTRNFVTTMYIGLLDRLVDSGGLDYFAEEFDAASDKRARAIQMAKEVMNSDEFQQNNATPSDYIVRFYRAFLGRFPSSAETEYWVGEINAGRATYESVIEEFAGSAEFTARLQQYFGS